MKYTIPIYVFDSVKKEMVQKQLDENEALGFRKNNVSEADLKCHYETIDCHISDRHLSSYWEDPDIDDESGKRNDILVYVGFQSFRCPYSKELINLLNSLL